MSSPEDRVEVRYTAKELFAQIKNDITVLSDKVERKLDVVADKLDAKADHDALVDLDARVTVLENSESERRGYGKAQAAIILLLLSIASLLVPIALSVIR